MMPLVHIAGMDIPSYSLAACLGVVLTIVLFHVNKTIMGISFKEYRRGIQGIFPWCIFGAFALGYVTRIPSFVQEGITFKDSLLQAGVVYYGGLIGGMLGLLLYTKEKGYSFYHLADPMSRLLPFGHSIGRVGCFLSGCCYGHQHNGLFSVHYPVDGVYINVYPVQLFEAATEMLIGVVLLSIRFRHEGNYTRLYLTLYAVTRFLLEFIRGDSIRGIWFGLSTSQWISIAILLFIMFKLWRSKMALAKI